MAIALSNMGYDITKVYETSLECGDEANAYLPFSVVWRCAKLPGEIEQFIQLFDQGNEVTPTVFEIPLELKE